MSKKDLKIYQVIEEYRSGATQIEEAIAKLGVTARTFYRKVKKLREQGIEGLVHRNRGRSPSNRKAADLREWYVELYKSTYYDFNFLHAFEFINERHQVPEKVCYDTFRKWLRAEGLGVTKKRRSSKARIERERHANEGLMLQFDGSPDRYNGEDVWTLIHAIDDATSKLLGAEFHSSESTWACMKVIRGVIKRHGIPVFILTDMAGWSARHGKRAYFSQFERACNELGITVISTPIPQSKGRVERSFRTAQGRLMPELRLEGIKKMETANRYLSQIFQPKWNEKFAVEARNESTRFKPIPAHVDLDEIFCMKATRMVNRDHTVHFEGVRYRLSEPPRNLWKHEVTVHQYETGEIKVLYGAEELKIEAIEQPKRIWRNAG